VTPNRPDFLSVWGIAREVSAATGTPLSAPAPSCPEDDEPAEGVATVQIVDLDRCPRYLARIVRGVRHVPAPIAVQARLTAAGMRPISAAVDATNYAMLEVGQPLHPFDLASLRGPGIVVRLATAGERLVTLDDVERKLTDDDLLICDSERPVAVAGVMGGELAEMSDATADVLLEAATFERGGIQRTRRRLDLSTEASMRFERGVDPEATSVGADRACGLMAEWCGARVLRGAVEVGAAPERRRLRMRASRASALIGYPVSTTAAMEVYGRLGIEVDLLDDDTIGVEVPGYRVDLEREVDLIEEVVRIQGYDGVGSALPAVRQTGGLPPTSAFLRRLRRALASAGVREVRLGSPFASDDDLALSGDADAIRVTNPLQADEGWLRTALLPGLLKAVRRNVFRHVRSVAIFEVSNVFGLVEGRPNERPSIALVMTGAADPGWTGEGRAFDVFDAKGVVEALLAELGIPWSTGEPAGHPFHPARSAQVLAAGETIGLVGELHPRVAGALDLPGRVAAAELEVEALLRLASPHVQTRDVPRFPPMRRDLAFVVDASVAAGALQAALEEAAGDLLDSALLFDVHLGPPLADGTKSLAFSVDLRAADRTLTDEEALEVVDAIAARLAADFGAELRSA
jgi:phenylalanyl-tRNA synthetase beta chain